MLSLSRPSANGYVLPSDVLDGGTLIRLPVLRPRAGTSTFFFIPRESHQPALYCVVFWNPRDPTQGPARWAHFYVLHDDSGQWRLLYYSARQP